MSRLSVMIAPKQARPLPVNQKQQKILKHQPEKGPRAEEAAKAQGAGSWRQPAGGGQQLGHESEILTSDNFNKLPTGSHLATHPKIQQRQQRFLAAAARSGASSGSGTIGASGQQQAGFQRAQSAVIGGGEREEAGAEGEARKTNDEIDAEQSSCLQQKQRQQEQQQPALAGGNGAAPEAAREREDENEHEDANAVAGNEQATKSPADQGRVAQKVSEEVNGDDGHGLQVAPSELVRVGSVGRGSSGNGSGSGASSSRSISKGSSNSNGSGSARSGSNRSRGRSDSSSSSSKSRSSSREEGTGSGAGSVGSGSSENNLSSRNDRDELHSSLAPLTGDLGNANVSIASSSSPPSVSSSSLAQIHLHHRHHHHHHQQANNLLSTNHNLNNNYHKNHQQTFYPQQHQQLAQRSSQAPAAASTPAVTVATQPSQPPTPPPTKQSQPPTPAALHPVNRHNHHHNHHLHQPHYNQSSSISHNCANNIITKTFAAQQENSSKQTKEPLKTTPATSVSENSSSSSSSSASTLTSTPAPANNGAHNNHNNKSSCSNQNGISSVGAGTNQQQQPLFQRQQHFHNFNINNNHHNHHHHYHHPPYHYHQAHQNQHQQHNTMAHYKFHNDCQSSVLTYEQVKRLDFVMDQTVPIHGRGNFPTLYVKLKELIRLVKYKLQKEHSIEIRDVRLNGGAASYVLAPENSHYNDLDLIFGTDLSNENQFDVIRDVVLECLKEFYPKKWRDQFPQQQQQQQQQPGGGKTVSVTVGPNESTANSKSSTGIGVVIGNKSATVNSAKINSADQKDCSSSNSCDSGNLKISSNQGNVGDDKSQVSSEERQASGKRILKCSESEAPGSNETTDQESLSSSNGCCSTKGQQAQLVDHATSSRIMQQQQQQQHFQYQSQAYNHQMPPNNCAIKEAYVHKMVKVNDDDRWSLISLGVQQSEANCCGQSSVSHQVAHRNNQQFANALSSDENEPKELPNFNEEQQSSAQLVSNENLPATAHYASEMNGVAQKQNQHPTASAAAYIIQQPQRTHCQQQKQFPNSIELKFVDRMRRKFEFSVDSFQIILDSLIQFYDYAPQSTIATQKILINSHPSSTMINTRPLMNKRRCTGCCASGSGLSSASSRVALAECKTNESIILASTTGNSLVSGQNYDLPHSHSTRSSMSTFSRQAKACGSLLNSSQSYYQLPIEPANSPSTTSEASSSGCSSSSSVVSSSSSSLSYEDEENEDLYCDADSPSSSASTSSLLSASLMSSEGLCSVAETAVRKKSNQVTDQQQQQSTNKKPSRRTQRMIEGSGKVEASAKNVLNKMKSSQTTVDELSSSTCKIGNSSHDCVECFGLQGHQQLQHNEAYCSLYDFETNNRTSCAVISENFYPTVIGRSEYGNFREALYHLEKKLIATRSPEEIRGGGLLKYCNLLVKNYKPTNVYQIRTLERYMCSRFFIDFSDLNQQQAKLESYLANHFSDDPVLKYDYLTVLHNVVQRSTVCLMNHELRLTLNMIRDLAYKLNEGQQEQQQSQQQQQQLASQAQSLATHDAQSQQQPPHHHQQVQQPQSVQTQAHHQQQQQQQHYYHQQKPVLIQSGVYRVKLVNYTLAKPIGQT